MTPNFRKPDAVDRMKEMLAEAEIVGDCWEEIGEPLDDGVKRKVPEYDEKLGLELNPTAEEVRQQVAEVAWGKLEREGKRLTGLGAALRDLAECIGEGTTKIRDHWQGPAADAFTHTTTSLVGSLLEASKSAVNAGSAVSDAVGAIRTLYGAGEPGGYRELSEGVFAFENLVQPKDIYKLDGGKINEIPLCGFDCHDEESGTLGRTTTPGIETFGRRATAHKYASNVALTRHWFRWYAFDYPQGVDHEADIRLAINESGAEFTMIPIMINIWMTATAALKANVSTVYQDTVDLLQTYSEADVFAGLKRSVGA